MTEPVKPNRSYDITVRAERAARTRQNILQAARELISEKGYVAATMREVAVRAGVSLDTVYASVGRKPALFRLLIETALSGGDGPVEAEQRDYVAAIRAAATAAEKMDIYAGALRGIQERLAPLVITLRSAATVDSDLRQVWDEIQARRAKNMGQFTQDLAATNELRDDTTLDKIADVIWATSSPEVYAMLTNQRGWASDDYERWLADSWKRTLLR
jgi:AcrR family transcriptional regulator